MPRRLAAALVAGALLALGCGERGAGGPGADEVPGTLEAVDVGGPIVLISIDTLRADRLPAYGYDGVSTPAIDALAADAIRFARAWAHYPLTLPSHASMLSGLLPPEHGVRDNVGYRFDGETSPYLPRQLRAHGYRTGAFVSSYLLRSDSGLATGFEVYDDDLARDPGAALAASQRPGDETVARALDWLETLEAGEPYFLFVHLYEPHTPYTPPEPFASRYDDPYDGEIAAADAIVATLLDALRARGDYDRATVVLTSDHGEGLGEHGEAEHGILLYREALQVPLLLKLPRNRYAGTAVDAGAQLIDLPPTLLTLAGVETSADGAGEGVSLLALRENGASERAIYAETYYPRLHLGWSELLSLVEGDLHYIEGPDPELYDLAADPGERNDVLAERRRDYARLRDALAPQRRAPEAPSAVDPEAAARLAALGYLSTSANTAGDGPLPDPKQNLHVLEDLSRGFLLSSQGDHAAAAEAFRRVLADNPEMADAWENLALSLHRLGRHGESLAAYERAMTLTGGTSHVALSTARLLIDMGRYDDAVRHAELALATDPAAANLVLASAALRADDVEAGALHARAALEAQPDSIMARLLLAQVSLAGDDLDAARGALDEANAIQSRLSGDAVTLGLFFVEGEVLAREGDAAAAEAAFRREIRLHPADPRAYTRLAFLFAFADRPGDATAVLRQLVEANPTPAAYAAAVETLRALGDQAQAARLLAYARSQFPRDPALDL